MIKIEHIESYGFEAAIRGMRNPMNSWDKSDTEVYANDIVKIGENDLKLMKQLYNAGTEHRKYLRQIMVSMDIAAPLYWWKQMDTYKIGTTANSCSTMHKLTYKEFERSDFSFDWDNISKVDSNIEMSAINTIDDYIQFMNILRNKYIETKDKIYWQLLVEVLPESYNQKRTITMNYENVVTIIKQRSNHKLQEWHDFCDTMLDNLPLIDNLMNDKISD